MTQQHGLFTVQTWIALTADLRARLEQLVRDERGDLADTLSRIVADERLEALAPAASAVAGDPLPVRLYLSAEQRAALEQHMAAHDVTLPALLSQIVAARLAGLPAVPAPAQAPSAPPPAELRRRRNELARLRARRDAAGAAAPAWLHAYIAELEAELAETR